MVPEKLDACVKLLAENRLEVTKNYEGCEGCFGSVNNEELVVTLWTRWQSAEHFDEYLKWRTQKGDFAEVLAFFDGEPKIKDLIFSSVDCTQYKIDIGKAVGDIHDLVLAYEMG